MKRKKRTTRADDRDAADENRASSRKRTSSRFTSDGREMLGKINMVVDDALVVASGDVRDDDECEYAFARLENAAQRGNVVACVLVGHICLHGMNPADPAKAREYYELAAVRFHSEGALRILTKFDWDRAS